MKLTPSRRCMVCKAWAKEARAVGSVKYAALRFTRLNFRTWKKCLDLVSVLTSWQPNKIKFVPLWHSYSGIVACSKRWFRMLHGERGHNGRSEWVNIQSVIALSVELVFVLLHAPEVLSAPLLDSVWTWPEEQAFTVRSLCWCTVEIV